MSKRKSPGGTRYLSIRGSMSIFGVWDIATKSYLGSVSYNFGKIQYLGPENYSLRKMQCFCSEKGKQSCKKTKAQSVYTINIIMTRLSQILRHSTTFYDSDSPKYLTTFRVSKILRLNIWGSSQL